jgi:hypothetical protein
MSADGVPPTKLRLLREEKGERTYDEAECEERSSLENATRHVAAMMALANEALVALEFLAERLLAADEEEEHGVCLSAGLAFVSNLKS